MTRGFITIATGKEHYYRIANNLLKSYRYFADTPLPFAIICEEENEYTKDFDDVIITNESEHSFMDKFLLLKLCPYDENIFIDADSLCYGDINVFWDVFKNATDFSAFGKDHDLTDNNGAWYNIGGIGKYGEGVTYKSRIHAGVMFIRRSGTLEKLYSDCRNIIRDYDSFSLDAWSNSKDEMTFGIAMPMNAMKSVQEPGRIFGAYPCLKMLSSDMLCGKLCYSTDWNGYTETGLLLHYGTFHTYEPMYRFDVECLDLVISAAQFTKKEKLLYEKRLRYYELKIPYEISRFFRRVINKLLRQHKDI